MMEEKYEVSKGCGYKYVIKDDADQDLNMVEYHVDDSIFFKTD